MANQLQLIIKPAVEVTYEPGDFFRHKTSTVDDIYFLSTFQMCNENWYVAVRITDGQYWTCPDNRPVHAVDGLTFIGRDLKLTLTF